MEKTDIYITQGKDYCEMTRELLEACDLASDIGNRKKRIGIKPNLAVAKPASSGATTHPEVLRALLAYLKEKGFENLTVMESSWVGEDTGHAVRESGLLDVCREQGVPFHDTKRDRAVTVDGAGMELHVCDRALEMDYLINMPVVKGHCQTTVTCALKNYKGLIPDSEKRRFHRLGLHRPIAHLGMALRQDFILADNICGDLDFEEGGNPVPMDRVLAFRDPVLCDSFAAETLGYRPGDIEYIRLAEELGVGSTDTAGARLHFVRPEGKREKKAAPRGRVGQLARYVRQEDACSACYGSLIYALDRLDETGYLKGKVRESIAIGQGFRGKEGEMGVGNCTRCFRRSLAGCPPKAVDIAEFLKREWEDER